jgi:hypothetical protein
MPDVTNFRQDLSNKIQEFSAYNFLIPTADKNYEISEINTRFLNIHHAVRSCYNAIADIASRDSSFLPSFFQDFVNPIYVKTIKYPNKTLHRLINGFNTNGTVLSYPEERVVYSYTDLGDITNSISYHYLVFKNGELMDKLDYDVRNSAFGLQTFIKDSKVFNYDEITLAVYRVYNNKYDYWQKNFTSNSSGLTEFIDVNSSFSNFYDAKYIKLAVRKYSEMHYSNIDSSEYDIVYENGSQKVKININPNILFTNGDTLIAYNCTSFWSLSSKITTSNESIQNLPSIPLIRNIPEINDGAVPVGLFSDKDLDIWVNGRHLTPGKHFTIATNISNENRFFINFLFESKPNTEYSIEIIKNIPFIKTETIYIAKDEIDSKGVEFVGNNKYPLFTGMGEMFINGYFIDPKKVSSISKNVLIVDDINETLDFFYKLNFPINTAINSILDVHMNKATELDKIVLITGGSNALIDRIKNERSDISTSTNPSIIAHLNGISDISQENMAVSNFSEYLTNEILVTENDYFIDGNNEFNEVELGVNLYFGDANFDSNIYIGTERIFDANESLT